MNNKKLPTDEEKEEAHRAIWKEVFKITQEKNQNYDRNTERGVEEYLRRNQDLHTPYDTSDLTTLQGRNGIDTLISIRETELTIKGFKIKHLENLK